MKRKVWVNAYVSKSINTETGIPQPDVWIGEHWETLDGSEADINAKYSGSRYQGMALKKKVADPGTFGGRYEHRTFEAGDRINDSTTTDSDWKNTGNWEDNS